MSDSCRGYRAAEVLYSLAIGYGRQKGADVIDEELVSFYSDLQQARRHLALLQHHDAITGTARLVVVSEYIDTYV